MSIDLKVLPGGTRARWTIGVSAPCSQPSDGMGVGFGTEDQPPDPLLRIRNGRFSLSRHGVTSIGTYWSYTLLGHTTRSGFAGTLHYIQRWRGGPPTVRCDSHVLHWTATRSKFQFP